MRSYGTVATLAFALTGASAAAASAQPAFEGVIAYEMNMGGMTVNMEQTVKGSMVRQSMQMPMGEMVSFVDTKTMDMTILMPAQKMYMKMNGREMMGQVQAMQQERSGLQPDPSEFQATGRTETIAGHRCEHYTWSSDDGDMDLCIATGLGFMPFASPQGGMGGRGMGGAPNPFSDAEKWRARFGDGFLPLSMSVAAEGGTMTMRATRVEPGSVSDSVFQIPEGFTEMAMPGGMR